MHTRTTQTTPTTAPTTAPQMRVGAVVVYMNCYEFVYVKVTVTEYHHVYDAQGNWTRDSLSGVDENGDIVRFSSFDVVRILS